MPRKYKYIKDFEKELIEYIERDTHYEKPERNMVSHIKKCEILKQDIIKINENVLKE